MDGLQIFLLGKFQARFHEEILSDFDTLKVQELFSYLLLNRDQPHHRETLSSLLWGDSQPFQSKKYLRQTLWQLQTALIHEHPCNDERILIVDNEWISINPKANLWLDFAVLEQSLALTNGTSGYDLETTKARALKDAVNLYHGDLLEGWYQDWCLFERERIQLIHLEILYKLMEYCEYHREYETGLNLGEQVLRYDRAQERTHYQLMRINYLAGNRTGALRQYERCVTSLEKDLGVKPSKRTVTLYEQIRADSSIDPEPPLTLGASLQQVAVSQAQELLVGLQRFRTDLANLQYQLDTHIQMLRKSIYKQDQ